MNPNAQFERDLEQWLQTEAPASAPAGFHASVMDRARTLRQRPGWTRTFPARRFGRGRGMTLLAAAALLLVGGAWAAGSGILRLPTVVPPVPEPSVIAVATASPDATFPSPTPSVRPSLGPPPSGPAGPLAWTEASLKEDWPAPVRPEPAGGASVQPMPLTYFDPTGDTGSDIDPWVDIRAVTGDTSTVHLKLVSNHPPVVDPAEQWIAYGVVIDDDRDGMPDWRYGIDNTPPDAEGEPMTGDSRDAKGAPAVFGGTRVWRTNLHTGRTDHRGFLGEAWRGVWPNGSDANFKFGGTSDTAGKGTSTWGIALDMPFYTWASVIVNGRVVATDSAPDAGWFIATPGAKPGGTYLLEDPFPLHLSMTVPDGWTDHGGPELTRDGGHTNLRFLVLDNPEDPCPDDRTPLGPSFDDLVSYLEAMPNIDFSVMRYGTVDGYRAVYLEERPVDGEFDCMGSSPISLESTWIVDVDGVRLVIAASVDSAPAEPVRSEVRQIVESIKIVGVSPSYSPPASPSPTPRPTPRPTPLPPAAGPVPPNARSWTVTVDNKSSEPATLFVAEDDEGGMLRLVGSATPNVVPAGATVQVTFRFPAKGGPDEGWITVNPRLGDGADVGLVGAGDIGIPGKILIREEGDWGWLSP